MARFPGERGEVQLLERAICRLLADRSPTNVRRLMETLAGAGLPDDRAEFGDTVQYFTGRRWLPLGRRKIGSSALDASRLSSRVRLLNRLPTLNLAAGTTLLAPERTIRAGLRVGWSGPPVVTTMMPATPDLRTEGGNSPRRSAAPCVTCLRDVGKSRRSSAGCWRRHRGKSGAEGPIALRSI